MLDADRFKLRSGPYAMPRCRVGRWLKCAIRGKVKVVGISDSPISWPHADRTGTKRESNQAVARHWGVCAHTVSALRKALGVQRNNDGTHELQAAWMPERLDDEARERHRQSLKSPERGAKIGAAQRGKPKPPAMAKKLRQLRKGVPHTRESREKDASVTARTIRETGPMEA